MSISLPLRDDTFKGAALLAVFDNLLPDNEPIRRRVAERVGALGTDTFSLLSKIGRDCVGAFQFLPEGELPGRGLTDQLSGRVLTTDDIAYLLDNLDVTPLGVGSDTDFRISIAGAQDKTALLFHNNQWLEPAGTTPPTHMFKPQIGKLPNGMDLSDSVENEYLCLQLMAGFGLATAHVEIMQLLRGSDEPTQDRYDFFKAQILFWLLSAFDGHAKNFSLALSAQGKFA